MAKFFKGSHLIFPILYKFRIEKYALQFLKEMAVERKISMNDLHRKILTIYFEENLPGFSQKAYETGKLENYTENNFQPQPAQPAPVQPPATPMQQTQPAPAAPKPPKQPPLPELIGKPTPERIKWLEGLEPKSIDPDVSRELLVLFRKDCADSLRMVYDEEIPHNQRRGLYASLLDSIETHGWRLEDYFPPGGQANAIMKPHPEPEPEIADVFAPAEPVADAALAGSVIDQRPDDEVSRDTQRAFDMIETLRTE